MSEYQTSFAYRNLPDFFYSDLEPADAPNPDIFELNSGHAEALDLDPDWLRGPEGIALLSGQSVLDGGPALAMAYGGHQFGHWSGLLGDGRARLVGDIVDHSGASHELHLKGAGQTPYSRRGDGKATLGSAIREYIVSEAMAALGVSTSRALSIVTTGDNVFRNEPELGAILCRTARSHIRVGTFQWATASGEPSHVKALADFSIDRLYPGAPNAGPERYRYFLREVIKRQADLVAGWMGFGFIHGVMNTDNCCVSGETIDYGPCAFMDTFHPAKVFSSIDRRGRYAWNKQPEMAHWNLMRFAETLLPLLGDTEEAQQTAAEADLNTFIPVFQTAFHDAMARKSGMASDVMIESDSLTTTLRAVMEEEIDYTLFFRNLTLVAGGADEVRVLSLFENQDRGALWFEHWKTVTGFDSGLNPEVLANMQQSNPVIIPRNHRVEQAIKDANEGDFQTFRDLLEAVTDPFSEREKFKLFEAPPAPDEVVHQTFCGT